MPRGGAREGAGRPTGQGRYQEKTRPVRIPESMVEQVLDFVISKGYQLPLYSSSVQAGFPSPADDYIESKLDLNTHLIKHPAATFFVRASGESMINAGIYPGDILIVDRSLQARHDKIVIVALNGQLTVKRLWQRDGEMMLMPENDDFTPIRIEEGMDMMIWGVVTYVLHQV
ncbi:MAG: translesion error-prone DNA polymerase V autoproteolytic subunit [Gammaproteobacteria bacterium]|jgi:DNA polymerase V|nr:translesion error-prone DNA polymerase V autoproteolytic subunit [Gammaproteobacteria bacterium]